MYSGPAIASQMPHLEGCKTSGLLEPTFERSGLLTPYNFQMTQLPVENLEVECCCDQTSVFSCQLEGSKPTTSTTSDDKRLSCQVGQILDIRHGWMFLRCFCRFNKSRGCESCLIGCPGGQVVALPISTLQAGIGYEGRAKWRMVGGQFWWKRRPVDSNAPEEVSKTTINKVALSVRGVWKRIHTHTRLFKLNVKTWLTSSFPNKIDQHQHQNTIKHQINI